MANVCYSEREMSKAADSTTKSPSEPATVSLSTIALDLLGTAWRIATPVLIFVAMGLFADRAWDTGPWLTLLGMVSGFGVAALLVKEQIKKITKPEDTV